MKCERCGKDKPDARNMYDPYDKDVNDELVEVVLCEKCSEERTDDI